MTMTLLTLGLIAFALVTVLLVALNLTRPK